MLLDLLLTQIRVYLTRHAICSETCLVTYVAGLAASDAGMALGTAWEDKVGSLQLELLAYQPGIGDSLRH